MSCATFAAQIKAEHALSGTCANGLEGPSLTNQICDIVVLGKYTEPTKFDEFAFPGARLGPLCQPVD
eukprot:5718608-Amphidinium_carterae.1